MRLDRTKQKQFRAELRRMLADYIGTEGCSCCQDIDGHKAASDALGKLLKVKKFSDGSGYDFWHYRTKDKQ